MYYFKHSCRTQTSIKVYHFQADQISPTFLFHSTLLNWRWACGFCFTPFIRTIYTSYPFTHLIEVNTHHGIQQWKQRKKSICNLWEMELAYMQSHGKYHSQSLNMMGHIIYIQDLFTGKTSKHLRLLHVQLNLTGMINKYVIFCTAH